MSDTTKDAVPLLPCPFCGAKAGAHEIGKGASWHPMIHCVNWCCSLEGTGGTRDSMRADAIKRWNRRAPAQVQAEAAPVDERAAFENWCETRLGLVARDFHQTAGGGYRSGYIDDMWDGWKARAELAAGDQS